MTKRIRKEAAVRIVKSAATTTIGVGLIGISLYQLYKGVEWPVISNPMLIGLGLLGIMIKEPGK